MQEFKVNDYISLKLEDKKTFIYVANEKFHKCKYLLLNISLDSIKTFDEIDSIDEAAEKLDKSMERERIKVNIPPETEFWGHCSNLQVWAENNYNTRVLHSNLAFSLLKKLVEAGDPKAKRVFKDEIEDRFSSGYQPVMIYLIQNGYLKYLNDEEIKTLIKQFEDSPDKIVSLLQSGHEISMKALKILAKGDPLPYIKSLIKHSSPENRGMFLYQIGSFIANVELETTNFESQVSIKKNKDSNVKLGVQIMELTLEYPVIPEKLIEKLPHLYGSQNRWDKAIIVYEKAIKQNGIKPIYITGIFMAAFYTGRQDIIDKYLEQSIENVEVLEDPYSISNVIYALNRKETEEDSKTALRLTKIYWNSLEFDLYNSVGGQKMIIPAQVKKMIPSLWVNMTDTFIVADEINDTLEQMVEYILNNLD